jgi:hypothetical protein
LELKSGIKGVRNFSENASLTVNLKTPLSNGLRKTKKLNLNQE